MSLENLRKICLNLSLLIESFILINLLVQKRETKAINKLCVREILSLSFVCGAYFLEFRGRNLVCFVFAYNFNGKYAPEAGKTRMRTAFFTRVRTFTGNWLICIV